MANETIFEARETAINELMHFAAHHGDGEAALMVAYLNGAQTDAARTIQVAYCLREVSRVLAARFDALTDMANEGRDVRGALVDDVIGAVDVLDAVRALLAVDRQRPTTAPVERAPVQLAPALEGLAWVEAAESLARFSGCAELAVSLLYLRGALAGDGGRPALNLAEALSIMTKDQATTLDALLEAEGAPEAVRDHTGGEECERRAALLASGWLWLRKLAAK